jgi:hypothetical protein
MFEPKRVYLDVFDTTFANEMCTRVKVPMLHRGKFSVWGQNSVRLGTSDTNWRDLCRNRRTYCRCINVDHLTRVGNVTFEFRVVSQQNSVSAGVFIITVLRVRWVCRELQPVVAQVAYGSQMEHR